jgi:hypothetical protein
MILPALEQGALSAPKMAPAPAALGILLYTPQIDRICYGLAMALNGCVLERSVHILWAGGAVALLASSCAAPLTEKPGGDHIAPPASFGDKLANSAPVMCADTYKMQEFLWLLKGESAKYYLCEAALEAAGIAEGGVNLLRPPAGGSLAWLAALGGGAVTLTL